MHKFILLTAVISTFCSNSWAKDYELKPLSEILQRENSEVMLAYAMQRCGGLFIVVARRAGRNPNSSDDIITQYSNASETFLQVAALLLSSQRMVSVEDGAGLVLETSNNFSNLYDRRMEEFYLRTGDSFDDGVKEDIKTCWSLYGVLTDTSHD